MRMYFARHLFAASVLLASVVAGGAQDAPVGNVVHLKRYEAATDSPGRYLFSQNNINLSPDVPYILSFWAKASQPVRLRISTKFDEPPWTGFGKPEVVELTSDWQRYEVPLDGAGASPGHTRLQFHFVELDHGDVWMADIQLKENGAAAEAENLVHNGRFEEALTGWYIEGVRKEIFEITVIPADAHAKN